MSGKVKTKSYGSVNCINTQKRELRFYVLIFLLNSRTIITRGMEDADEITESGI